MIVALITSILLVMLPLQYQSQITSDEIVIVIIKSLKLILIPISFLYMKNFIDKKMLFGYALLTFSWLSTYTMLYLDFDSVLNSLLSITYEVFSMVGIIFIVLGYKMNKKVKLNLLNELEKTSYYDRLTKLPNANIIFSSLGINQTVRTNGSIIEVPCKDKINLTKQSIFIFLDIKDLKLVNDNLGIKYGDLLLEKFAKRIKECIKDEDLAIRLNSDEFLIIVYSDNPLNDIDIVMSKLTRELTQTYYLKGEEVNINCSYGVAVYPYHDKNIEEVIRKADIAMYKAKEEGINTYAIYDDSFNKGLKEKFVTYNELKSALKNNEFIIYYQAKASTCDNKITGLEALVRWVHPSRGIISPGYFIPVMEETGLIKDLDILVLKKVCNQINEWKKCGFDLVNVSINISPKFFSDKMFISLIDETITKSNIDPKYISIEITENVALTDVEQTRFKIQQLKLRKIQVFLDDFGKGYSSLNYIKNYPIDCLKIDKTFVDEITNNPIDQILVKAFIDVCKKLSVKVVCEGVEREDQLETIKNLGCHEYQGYLLSKPQCVEEIEKFINSQKIIN